jgi:hypothetical protein
MIQGQQEAEKKENKRSYSPNESFFSLDLKISLSLSQKLFSFSLIIQLSILQLILKGSLSKSAVNWRIYQGERERDSKSQLTMEIHHQELSLENRADQISLSYC